MTPIMCVGETLDEREAGASEAKVVDQLRHGAGGLDPEAVAGLVVAYEPIWAIGTGRTANPADAQAMCAAPCGARCGSTSAPKPRPRCASSTGVGASGRTSPTLMAQPDIDGALVGGASLDPDEFAQIVDFAGLMTGARNWNSCDKPERD